MSEDPIGFSAGDVNLNRYVGNSPVNGVDPSGLEEAETSTDLSRIPASRIQDMIKHGFATKYDGYVHVVDIMPSGFIRHFLFEPMEDHKQTFYDGVDSVTLTASRSVRNTGRQAQFYRLIWLKDESHIDWISRKPEDALKAHRSRQTAKLLIEGYEAAKKESRALTCLCAIEFTASLVPFFSAADAAVSRGDYTEAGISLVGDVAFFFVPAAKLVKSGRKAKNLLKASVAIEATVGGIRGTQGMIAVCKGEFEKGSGLLGEATLRLLGLGAGLRQLKKAAATAPKGAFDPFLGAGGEAGFGKLVNWGVGARGATARTASITKAELQQMGMTREVAQHWLNFYKNAVDKGRGAATAPERIKLMERILELLD